MNKNLNKLIAFPERLTQYRFVLSFAFRKQFLQNVTSSINIEEKLFNASHKFLLNSFSKCLMHGFSKIRKPFSVDSLL